MNKIDKQTQKKGDNLLLILATVLKYVADRDSLSLLVECVSATSALVLHKQSRDQQLHSPVFIIYANDKKKQNGKLGTFDILTTKENELASILRKNRWPRRNNFQLHNDWNDGAAAFKIINRDELVFPDRSTRLSNEIIKLSNY